MTRAGGSEPLDITETAVVTVSTGAVRGTIRDGVARYLGVPYAQPPFGARRFAPPQPAAAWTGERDGTAFGPTAPQRPYPPATAELLASVEIPGEDILTANVWAPRDATDAPVVVWIHGGALERGTPALSGYDGTPFARDGVVYVSLGYRVGSEGFSAFAEGPANLGLQDVAAGLAWVHREVVAFGGSPERITIMGESAGGALVAALLARADTRRLVRGGIIQSGPLEAVSRERAGRVTRALADVLGIPATAEAFRATSPGDLLHARAQQSAASSPLRGAPSFTLAIDEDALPASPHDALADVDLPLLIGSNTDEYRLWFSPPMLAAISAAKAALARISMRVPRRATRDIRAAFPDASPGEVLGQLVTDRMLRAPLTRVARARRARTFVYEFAWQSPVRDLRAAHAVEIAFAFGDLDNADAVRLCGTAAPRALADEMHAAWVAFIRDGDPGWAPYGSQRWTRVFDETSATVTQRRAVAADAL